MIKATKKNIRKGRVEYIETHLKNRKETIQNCDELWTLHALNLQRNIGLDLYRKNITPTQEKKYSEKLKDIVNEQRKKCKCLSWTK